MSAPVTHDPLVVNTQDGSCWRRRAVNRSGRGLYALADAVAGGPDEVLATLAELAEHGLSSMAFALPVPAGDEPKDYPPALPWAALLDDEDLTEFLGDLIDALNSNPPRTRDVLVEVEKTCGTWRLIAEAQHGHNTAPGPNGITQRIAPTQALRESGPSAEWLAETFSPRQAAEGEFHAYLHRAFRTPHDLDFPGTGGAR